MVVIRRRNRRCESATVRPLHTEGATTGLSEPDRDVLKFTRISSLLVAAIILPWLVATAEARSVDAEEAGRVSKKWIDADNRLPALNSAAEFLTQVDDAISLSG